MSKVRGFALLSIAILALVLSDIRKVEGRVTGTSTNADIWCVGPDGAEACVDSSGNFLPTTDNDTTSGTSSLRWATVHTLDATIGDDLTVTDDAAVNGDLTIGDASADTFVINATTAVIRDDANSVRFSSSSSSEGSVTLTIAGSTKRVGIGSDSSPDSTLEVAPLSSEVYSVRVSSANGSTDQVLVDVSGLLLPLSRTTTQVDSGEMKPRAAGGLVFNSTLNVLCISTGTALGAYARVDDNTNCR